MLKDEDKFELMPLLRPQSIKGDQQVGLQSQAATCCGGGLGLPGLQEMEDWVGVSILEVAKGSNHLLDL